jgi:hypothetical protein
MRIVNRDHPESLVARSYKTGWTLCSGSDFANFDYGIWADEPARSWMRSRFNGQLAVNKLLRVICIGAHRLLDFGGPDAPRAKTCTDGNFMEGVNVASQDAQPMG